MGVQNQHLLLMEQQAEKQSKKACNRLCSHAKQCKGECLLGTSAYDSCTPQRCSKVQTTPQCTLQKLQAPRLLQSKVYCAYLDFWQDDSIVGKCHRSQGSQSIESFVSTGPRHAVIFWTCLHSLCIVVVAPCTVSLYKQLHECGCGNLCVTCALGCTLLGPDATVDTHMLLTLFVLLMLSLLSWQYCYSTSCFGLCSISTQS